MIYEIARFRFTNEHIEEFRRAFAEVAPLLSRAKGCDGHFLAQGIETPELFHLIVLEPKAEFDEKRLNGFQVIDNDENVVHPFKRHGLSSLASSSTQSLPPRRRGAGIQSSNPHIHRPRSVIPCAGGNPVSPPAHPPVSPGSPRRSCKRASQCATKLTSRHTSSSISGTPAGSKSRRHRWYLH